LLDARGQVVEKDALIGAVWPDVIVEDGNLAVQTTVLRKALGTKPNGTDWIVTVRQLGYRLIVGEAIGESEAGGAAVRPAIAVLSLHQSQQQWSGAGIRRRRRRRGLDHGAQPLPHLSRRLSRSSSFVYKGRGVDAREAARDLGVRYLNCFPDARFPASVSFAAGLNRQPQVRRRPR
ncbi:MAG: putative two component transcriptional regulator, receiver domain protein, partial [Hyphomicrobiales bacterium]|nr:putative two component transcriptional regulator, receiver domain protein [Hyphomicrobiales bacterium]